MATFVDGLPCGRFFITGHFGPQTCEVYSLTTVHTLASGSSGNALLLSHDGTHLLVDAGISCRRITTALRELGLALEDLAAIFITHTHSDHIAGLQTMLKRPIPSIWATEQTGRGLCYRLAGVEEHLETIAPCQSVDLNGVSVTAVPTSHDAPGACGFRFDTANGSVGVLTDSGYITDEAADLLPGVDLAVLEANHDIETLRSGPYPYYLKQRILGTEGHLSNEASARFAVTLAESGASEIVLAHLSRENNTPAMARTAVETALSAAGLSPALSVAPRDTVSTAYVVNRRSVCRK